MAGVDHIGEGFPMNYVIRVWTESDIGGIAAIMCSHALWQHYGVTLASATIRLVELFAAGEKGWVVENDAQQVMGFILYNTSTFGNSGYIRLFGIQADATHHGLGQDLLRAVERDLRDHQVNRLVLLCTAWNHRARRFYERMGFEKIGDLPDWIQDGTTEVLYVKHLDRG